MALCVLKMWAWLARLKGCTMTHLNLPHPSELARQVSVFPALQLRKQRQSNIWFFDSPKNNARLTIHTDLAFMHLVILEGDPTVLRYVPTPGPEQMIINGTQVTIKVNAHVHRADGTLEWWDFKRFKKPSAARGPKPESPGAMAEQAAAGAKATYCLKTDADLAGQEILFDNWLTICAGINRCRNQFLEKEAQLLLGRLRLQQAVTLESLITMPDIDVACMLAAIGIALQTGTARASLANQIWGRSTTLSRGDA